MIKFVRRKILFALLTVVIASAFIACDNEREKVNDIQPMIISIDGAQINDNEVFMTVESKVESVTLSEKVVCSESCVWKLFYDNLGQKEIPTKIATGLSGKLANGDNKFYIVVSSLDEMHSNTYELTIHRSYSVPIRFRYIDRITQNDIILEQDTVNTGDIIELDYSPTIDGYSFLNWTYNGKSVSRLQIWDEIDVYANLSGNKCKAKLNSNGGDLGEGNCNPIYGELCKLPIPTKRGHSFLGWFNGDESVSDSLGIVYKWYFLCEVELVAKWETNSYKVNLCNKTQTHCSNEVLENEIVGWSQGEGNYSFGSTVTLHASLQNGYAFLGWYDESGNCRSKDCEFEFVMGDGDENLNAVWETYIVEIEVNDKEGGKVAFDSDCNSDFAVWNFAIGETVNVWADTNDGYTWLGWFNDSKLISKSLQYSFIMDEELSQMTAKWIKCPIHIQNDEHTVLEEFPSKTIAGQKYSAKVKWYYGYSTVEWFCGNELLAKGSTLTFVMPESDSEQVVFEAKAKPLAELENFVFESGISQQDPLVIHSVIDTSVESLVVPDCVTGIAKGTFTECHNLISLTLPHLGISSAYGYALCELFGRERYSGSKEVEYINFGLEGTGEYYYIPQTLRYVVVKGGDVRCCAFEGCGLTVIFGNNVLLYGVQWRFDDPGTYQQETYWCEFGSDEAGKHHIGELTLSKDTVVWDVKWEYVDGIPTRIE